MIIVKVSDSGRRYGESLINEQTATPRSVLEEKGIRYEGAHISMNGTILSGSDLDKTFASLGAINGTVSLSAIVKADGACK